ncbi:MAG: KH domain-containing protein [Gammaproteobacteria bacterium]|nr:KH domain-containing protein [Gammaproteobacteria bacterium]
MKSIQIRARTVAEAIRLALNELGKDRDEVAIEVLEPGGGEDEALVRVTSVDDDDDAPATEPEVVPGAARGARGRPVPIGDVEVVARRVLEELLQHMDIDGFVSAVRSTVPDQRGEPEETITLHVEGVDEDAMGLMIGRRGETLRSIQFMVNLIVQRQVHRWPQITVDVGNYRQRRQESIEALARRMADRVRQTGRPLMLEPMGGYERRIVHLVLRADASVYTESSGEGEERKVVIFPARTTG